jgi:hypothetical protein
MYCHCNIVKRLTVAIQIKTKLVVKGLESVSDSMSQDINTGVDLLLRMYVLAVTELPY